MLGQEARDGIARLTTAVMSVEPLITALGTPVRVVPVASRSTDTPPAWPPGRWNALRTLLDRVARGTGVSGLVLSPVTDTAGLHLFERVVSDRLALADLNRSSTVIPVDRIAEVDAVVARAAADGFGAFLRRDVVTSRDGTRLSAYAAGSGRDVVVLVPACGIPVALSESWVRHLARGRRVLIWESRGLFGPPAPDDLDAGLPAQTDDLFAVMDHFGAFRAHVVGLCGGAVIALAAAAAEPDRIRSLSLWHGAYPLGGDSPQTDHQHNLIALMGEAARSRAAAKAAHSAFCQVMLTSVPAAVAHLVLYPYATPELFYRYCRVNSGLTSGDLRHHLPLVRQPALVVTSTDDSTAHPRASALVADGLSNGMLHVEAHGDHLSLFAADPALMEVAVDFMDQHGDATLPAGGRL